MTEQEAKTKWCPMVKIIKVEAIDSRRLPYCIASGCMMWLWVNGNNAYSGYQLMSISVLLYILLYSDVGQKVKL